MIYISSVLSFYVTHSRLNEIIDKEFENSKEEYNKCNIIIDLASSLNSSYYNKMYSIRNNNLNIDILKDILNIIYHYKSGLKKYNVKTSFYFVYSENSSKTSLNFYPYYNTNMRLIKSNNSVITNHINSALLYFKKLWKFLDNCIYIESESDSSHIIYKIIKDISSQESLNMIITKDPVSYQNINSNNDIIIRPYKDIKEKKDMSYIINNKNKFEYLLKSYNISKNIKDFEISFNQDSNIISSTMVLSGIKQRSYNKLFKINETINIFNQYCSIYNTKTVIPIDLFKSFKSENLIEELICKWKAIDSKYNYNIINDIIEYNIIKLNDINFLYKLNEKYFNNEVKIDEIC